MAVFRDVVGTCYPRAFTTVELADKLAKYGPAGTEFVGAMEPGVLVWDSTLSVLKVYNGTAFVTVTVS